MAVRLFVAHAELPLARLHWVFPPGASVGSTQEIGVGGLDLEDPVGLRFSDPRITAVTNASNSAVFTVTIPTNVPAGPVEVRWWGRFGLSNPRTFVVSSLAERVSPATNTTSATALELPLGTVVNGRAQPNQASWFRIKAAAGQRLGVQVDTRKVDSRLEPVLVLCDREGRPLQQSRRGFLDFLPTQDFEGLVQVHDVTYRGGEDFLYRLTVSTGPQVDFALPNVLRAGETNSVVLYGRNLPGGTPSLQQGADGQGLVELVTEIVAPEWHPERAAPPGLPRAASAGLGGEAFLWRDPAHQGLERPLLFLLTTNAVVVAGTNGLATVTPPSELSGFFPRRGEVSGARFEAKKGEVYWVEVFADRLGWPCDPQVVVQRDTTPKGSTNAPTYADVLELNDTEANLGGTDFNTVNRDAAGRLEIPEDGSYRILVRDLFNRGSATPQYPYRLSVRRETPDFAAVAIPVQPVKQNDNDRNVHCWTPFLRRGETLAVRVVVFRRDGFNGEIELTVSNLPQGITARETRILAGQNSGMMLLTAAESGTDPAQVPLEIRARAKVSGQDITHVLPLSTVAWPVPDFNEQVTVARLVQEPLVSVSTVESAPISIAPVEEKTWEAPAGGKWSLPVKVTRRGDFKGAVSLKPTGRPEFDKAKPVTIPENATNAVLEFDWAEAKLPEGTYTVWLQGTLAGKYQNNPEAAVAAAAEVKAAETALAAASESEKPKREEAKKAAEEKRKAAEEKAKPRDVTLMVYSVPFVVKVVPPPPPPAAPAATPASTTAAPAKP